MKTELIEVSPTHKQLVFEIPSDVVDQEINRVARDYGKAARLPGFRPGKAPEKLVRQRFRDRILHDVAHELIPKTLDEALRERSLEPVDTPDISDVSPVREGEPLTFKAAFDTLPPVEPVDYTTITLRRTAVDISDETVTSASERVRDRHARYEPVDDRGVGSNDVLTADLVRRVLGKPDAPGSGPSEPESHTDLSIEVGSTVNPPGFDAEIMGMQPGESRTFSVTFPPAYEVEELAGALVEYTVSLKAIKRKVLPDLDDEFAKDLELGSLEELRNRIREDLRREAERAQEREIRGDLLRQLAQRITFDVPERLIAREVERRLNDFVGRLVDSGVDPNRAQIDWKAYQDAQREPAVDTVKSLLLLDDIARREDIEVAPEELDAELARFADRTGKSAAVVRAKLVKEGGLSRLITGMRRDKTVEFVLSRATIVYV